jgi:hypothetical protein
MTQGGSPDTQGGSPTTHPADLKDVPGGRDILEHSPHIVVLVGLGGTECVVSRHQCAWDAQAACNRMAIRAASAQIPGKWEVRKDGVGGRQQRYRTWEVRQDGVGGRVLAGPVPRGVEWPEDRIASAIEARRAERAKRRLAPPPRYDEVFHRGTAWLDSLADEEEND